MSANARRLDLKDRDFIYAAGSAPLLALEAILVDGLERSNLLVAMGVDFG